MHYEFVSSVSHFRNKVKQLTTSFDFETRKALPVHSKNGSGAQKRGKMGKGSCGAELGKNGSLSFKMVVLGICRHLEANT